jgi:tetratricopeptide (TPR) repeat protein
MRKVIIAIALCIGPLASAQNKGGDKDTADPKLALYYEANRLYNIKVYTLAAEKFRAFLAANPTHPKAPEARYGLGLSLYEKKEFAEAEKIFADLAKVASNPNLVQILLLRGQCLLALNKPAEASAVFATGSKRAGVPNPVKAQFLAGLVESQTREKKWEDVVSAADLFLKFQNNNADPLVGRIRFHLASAQHRSAESLQATPNQWPPPVRRSPATDKAFCHRLTASLPAVRRRENRNA